MSNTNKNSNSSPNLPNSSQNESSKIDKIQSESDGKVSIKSSILTQNQDKMPQVIILYGPPAAGKGTQADFLKQNLPDYFHLDFGTALRSFVASELGNYFDPKVNKQIAKEIKNMETQKTLNELRKESEIRQQKIEQNLEKPEQKNQEIPHKNNKTGKIEKPEKQNFQTPNLEKIENSDNSESKIVIDNKIRAYRIWQALTDFEAVLFEDLQFVVENSLKKIVENGQKIILEGPGRSLLEANWLSDLFASLGLQIVIFHLYISPSETVKRSATRFYVKGIEKPFQSYKIAKENCPNGEPYRRPEDEDSDGIMNRYNKLYADIFAQIISVYQLKAKAVVLTVDANKMVQTVSQTLENYLTSWYL